MLNIGSCDLPLPKPWINIDNSTSPHIKADLVMDGRELDKHFNANSVDEIYAAHFLEHLTPEEGNNFIKMCVKLLKPGGRLTIVTPDMRKIAELYLVGDITIDELNQTYIFSYVQESLHKSCYDINRLTDVFTNNGLTSITEIDRMGYELLAYPAIWQCGVTAIKRS